MSPAELKPKLNCEEACCWFMLLLLLIDMGVIFEFELRLEARLGLFELRKFDPEGF